MEPVNQLIGGTFRKQYSLIGHGVQIPLKRPAVDFWAQTSKFLDTQAAIPREMIKTC